MSAQRAPLFVQEPDCFALKLIAPEQETYDGTDRRMESRRQQDDRRVDVRFNITRRDRRESAGRRTEDVLPTLW